MAKQLVARWGQASMLKTQPCSMRSHHPSGSISNNRSPEGETPSSLSTWPYPVAPPPRPTQAAQGSQGQLRGEYHLMRVGEPLEACTSCLIELDSTRPRPQPTPGLEVRGVGWGEGGGGSSRGQGQWCAPSRWRDSCPIGRRCCWSGYAEVGALLIGA